MIWLTAVIITSVYGLFQLADRKWRKESEEARNIEEFEAGKSRNNVGGRK